MPFQSPSGARVRRPNLKVAHLLLYLCAGNICAAEVLPSSPTRQRPALEEVIVTAQRREERLEDVPISLTVFPGAQIEQQQIDDLSDLQYAAPNLSIVPWPGDQNRANIGMRGHVEPDRFPTLDPAVGVYLNGVYIARLGGANLDLFDIERVEVLRGPQGTLFGRNAIGGAINVVPRKPGSEFAGTVTAGIGNFDRIDLSGALDLPLAGNEYVLRIAATHTEHGGYGRNTLLGRNISEEDTSFVRTQLRLAPSDHWDVNLSFDFTRSLTDRDRLTLVAVHPPLTLIPATAGNPDDRLENYVDPYAHDVRANRAGAAESEVWGASGTLTTNSSGVTLRATAAYRSLDSGDNAADLDGTPYDLFTVFERHERQDQTSLELQVFDDAPGGRLDWMGGLLYFDEGATYTERFQAVELPTLVNVENVPRGQVHNDSMAVFGQLTYALTRALRLTAGARYNEDRRQLTSGNARQRAGQAEVCTLDPAVRDEAGVCRATLPTRSFSYAPWTLGLDFKPIDTVLLYAKVSRGHRAGGYNFRGTSEFSLDTFEPEQVTAYEVGARAELFGERLRWSLALYRSLIDDLQLRLRAQAPGTLTTLALTGNGGESRIQGAEIEATALLGRVRISGALGITDAQYTKLDPDVLDVKPGYSFLNTPDTTASLAVDLPIALAPGEIELHGDYSWRDEVSFAYDPSSPARQEAYGLLNAMLTARLHRANLEFKLWARNLTDQRYLARIVDSGFMVTAIPGQPRTYGASVTWRFVRSK